MVSVCRLERWAGPQQQRDVSVSAPRQRALHLRNQVMWQNQQAVRRLAPPAEDGVTEPLEIAESGLFNISCSM